MTYLQRNWRGLLAIVLGLVTVLGAHYMLDVCADAGKAINTAQGMQVPMRCSWTERAVEGTGGLIALIGLIMTFSRESVRGLSLAVSGAGLLMLITPIWLIPTCDMASMTCNLSFKPGTMLLGGLIAIAGLVMSIRLPAYAQSRREKAV